MATSARSLPAQMHKLRPLIGGQAVNAAGAPITLGLLHPLPHHGLGQVEVAGDLTCRPVPAAAGPSGLSAFAAVGPASSWSLCGVRIWRRLRRFGPVPKPPQETECSLAEDVAPEQGGAGDCEERRQLDRGEGLAGYAVKRPEDNGRRQRPCADRQQVPATLASGQRLAR
jgi:hypothetical protein